MGKKTHKPDNSIRIEQKEKIKQKLDIREFPWTEKQKEFIRLVEDKNSKIILVKGAAGTAKTLLSVYTSLKALNEKKIGEIVYVRQAVESSTYNLGFLPGNLEEKMNPYLQPLVDKLNELVRPQERDSLIKDGKIRGIAVGHLRGLSINAAYIIADEAQNLTVHDLLLLTTRLGKFSKLICIGDLRQPDIRDSGFEKVYDLFDTEESKSHGVYTYKFGRDDIMRNSVLSFIIEKFESL
jgi:phosphate starvation-inducible PhoH-like protein